MVERAEDWAWSSLGRSDDRAKRDAGPVKRPRRWMEVVNRPQTEQEVDRLRRSVRRNRPFGDDDRTAKTAAALGLEASLRPRDRPKKDQNDGPSLFSE